ncbi:MAG: membrane-associated protein [Parcubacteria group bacterium Gr01-1014_8]|nr:MAG: membrane-associated protein [Parcubacteria group bacterium Gr01-1014_8]
MKDILAAIWLPLFSLAAFVSFYLVWTLLDLPPQEEIISLAREYFDNYGLLTVFVSAILEAALMVGWYYPGSLVIVLGAIFAGSDLVQLGEVLFITSLGFLVAHTFNFYIGKYGWYRLLVALGFREALEKAKSQLIRYGPRAIFLTYWHPNLGALTSTAAGILSMPFRTVALYSIAATLLWNTMWTTLAYFLGDKAIAAIGPKFVLAFIAVWVLLILVRKKKHDVAEDTIQSAR